MKKSIYMLVILFIMIFASPIFAQKTIPDPGADPDAVPLDGGIGLLVAAGVLYGAKKVNDRRNK